MPDLSTLMAIALGLLATSMALHGVAVWATFRRTDRRIVPDARPSLAGLSLLKPLKGLEDELETNLRSFLTQRYSGPLEILFCADDSRDPGLALARKVASEFPAIDVKFLTSDPSFGANPKVSNMQAGLEAAQYPYILQSDANVRLAPGYLTLLMQYALDTDADMVGSLVVGSGERTLGAWLENLQLTAFVTPAVCIAKEIADVPCVIGKSMLLKRQSLMEIGGLHSVRNVLAEDFVLAETFQSAGMRVVLSPLTVTNINSRTGFRQFLARHSRWLKMRAVIHLPAHLAEPFPNPSLFSLIAALLSGLAAPWVILHFAVVAYKCQWDRTLMRRLRGASPPFHKLFLVTQIRDIVLPCIWLYASFSRTTEWRGRRFRIGRGSRLLSLDEPVCIPELAVASHQAVDADPSKL